MAIDPVRLQAASVGICKIESRKPESGTEAANYAWLGVALMCPCCGEMKHLEHTLGQSALALAVAAQRDFKQKLKTYDIGLQASGRCLRACSNCAHIAGRAVTLARKAFPACDDFNRRSSTKADAGVLPQRPVVCGSIMLVSFVPLIIFVRIYLLPR